MTAPKAKKPVRKKATRTQKKKAPPSAKGPPLPKYSKLRRPARVQFQEYLHDLRGGYEAGRDGRIKRERRDVATTPHHADYHIRSEPEYFRMLETARDIDRNDMIVGQGVDRFCDSVLQDGMILDPQTGDKEVNNYIFQRWEAWSTNPDMCDIAGEMSFRKMERLALRAQVVDGDAIALGLENFKLQFVEGHRVRSPTWSRSRRNIVWGIQLGPQRQRLAYYITREDPSPYQRTFRLDEFGDPIPTRDSKGHRQLFHVYNPKRLTQTRGITALAPVTATTSMLDDAVYAYLLKTQVAACAVFLRETPQDVEGGLVEESDTNEEMAAGAMRIVEELAPGLEITSEPGEKITGFTPSIPNAEFMPFSALILSIIAVNLGVPVQVLLLDATKTNFSGWRGALDQARISYRRTQKDMVDQFHRPVYQWFIRHLMANDRPLRDMAADTGANVFGHRWNAPGWNYIEPLKDAQADDLQKSTHQNSQRRIQALRGRDWDEVVPEICEDNKKLILEAYYTARDINQEVGEDIVDWRTVLNPDASVPRAPVIVEPPAGDGDGT